MLASGLLVVHDTGRGGKHNVSELTGRQQLDNPLLKLVQADVVPGRDDTGLVQAGKKGQFKILYREARRCLPAVELDDDLAGAVVIDFLKLANVAWRMN